MRRAAQTFHLATPDGWRTIAAGTEVADDDPAVTTAPQYFAEIDEQPVEDKPRRRGRPRKTPPDGDR
ncbi:hypothetical protein E1295_31890 [Nonomuraea mesophila]|uniref:Uncharacterized protein n=1 Tax=Nonomuraea mesophila TaxID=2530382 RepID=A0A4R5EZL2_9ACTN|nr:hypothetical protein [Nonomuraea mesophila]TDE40503.1 hypothetical protein E1295_31890 [Nonomuraea mesophila]